MSVARWYGAVMEPPPPEPTMPKARWYGLTATGAVQVTPKARWYGLAATGTAAVIVVPPANRTGVEPGEVVSLTAALSGGGTATSWAWRHLSGAPVTPQGSGPTVTITAPAVMPTPQGGVPADCTIRLGVRATAGGVTSTEQVVTVQIYPHAGPWYYNWPRAAGAPLWLPSLPTRTSNPTSPATVPTITATAPTGWTREGSIAFTTDAALGQVATPMSQPRGGAYPQLELYEKDWTGNSGGYYDWTKTLTVSGGTLQLRAHVDSTGRALGAAMHILHPTLGRAITPGHAVEAWIKVVGSSPFGHALLLWPNEDLGQNTNPLGEMDWNEGGHNDKPRAYHHEMGAHPERNFAYWDNPGGAVRWGDWNLYRLEWSPTIVRYLVNGTETIRVTDTNHIPTVDFKLVLQCATHLREQQPTAGDTSTIHVAGIAFDKVAA